MTFLKVKKKKLKRFQLKEEEKMWKISVFMMTFNVFFVKNL